MCMRNTDAMDAIGQCEAIAWRWCMNQKCRLHMKCTVNACLLGDSGKITNVEPDIGADYLHFSNPQRHQGQAFLLVC